MNRLSVLRIGGNLSQLLHNSPCCWFQIPNFSYNNENIILREAKIYSSFSSPPTSLRLFSTLFARTTYNSVISSQYLVLNRMVSSTPSTPSASSTDSGPSNIVLVKSEGNLKKALSQVQDKLHSDSAIFYFTAAWCGPCRSIAPLVSELGEKYPHVTIYKIDIDQEGLGNLLTDLQITSVPTFYFYHKGDQVFKISSADVAGIKYAMEKYYA